MQGSKFANTHGGSILTSSSARGTLSVLATWGCWNCSTNRAFLPISLCGQRFSPMSFASFEYFLPFLFFLLHKSFDFIYFFFYTLIQNLYCFNRCHPPLGIKIRRNISLFNSHELNKKGEREKKKKKVK